MSKPFTKSELQKLMIRFFNEANEQEDPTTEYAKRLRDAHTAMWKLIDELEWKENFKEEK